MQLFPCFQIAMMEFDNSIVLHIQFRTCQKEAVGKQSDPSAACGKHDLPSQIAIVELNPHGRFQNHLRKEDLTGCEHISVLCSPHPNSDPPIAAGVIEGASHHGAVRIVGGFSVFIVNEKAHLVGIKTAGGKHIVSPIVDTAIGIANTVHIGKAVVFAEMADVDPGKTPRNVAVGSHHGT